MVEIYRMEFDITGKRIQKAGFRSAIEDIALDLGITGIAENKEEIDESKMKVYSVHVVAEGKMEGLKAFIERINSINTFHKINKVDTSVLNTVTLYLERKYPEFSIKRGENEVPERMDEAAYYMKHMSGDMKEMSNETKNMREETHNNFQTMEKKYHNISNKLNLFVGIIAEYIKSEKPELKDTVDALQEQYKD